MRVSLLVNHDGSAAPDAGGAGWLYPQTFELAAAETREVSLFGEGSPVRGSITIPPGASLDGLSAYAELDHREPSPAVPYPPEIYDGTSAERKAWFAKWEQTPAYQIWNKSSKAAREKCANYPVGWKSATTFQAEEVPPGNYDLDIKFVDPANQNKSIFASETVHFVVSTHASKLGDKALDLPPISLHRVPDRATVGQPALDFVVQSFDGKLIRLSDYRGKFVLLDFWATWCGPCIAEIPNLTACYEKFNSTGRFAILSVSYDESAAKAKAYVDAQHMPWGQAWIGNPQPPEVGEAYLNGLPTVLLIGPDGKVLATDIRGPEMVNHISDALK
ncbi:MAG: TlpA family protein disulfide reductase [Phycisphaerae bacterium]|nr:TlpA family protein disulfide reductase [Phycisphaerae bacterium]